MIWERSVVVDAQAGQLSHKLDSKRWPPVTSHIKQKSIQAPQLLQKHDSSICLLIRCLGRHSKARHPVSTN